LGFFTDKPKSQNVIHENDFSFLYSLRSQSNNQQEYWVQIRIVWYTWQNRIRFCSMFQASKSTFYRSNRLSFTAEVFCVKWRSDKCWWISNM